MVQQSQTATALAAWLAEASGQKEHDGIPAGSIHSVLHASLQKFPASWDVQKQHPGGHGATFSVLVSCLGRWEIGEGHDYQYRISVILCLIRPLYFATKFSYVLTNFPKITPSQLATPAQARLLPLSFQLMQPATSLGGVESLTEWRYPVDPLVDQRLVRVSIGLEELQDLKEDWRRALKKVIAEASTETNRAGEVGV